MISESEEERCIICIIIMYNFGLHCYILMFINSNYYNIEGRGYEKKILVYINK